MLGAGDSLTLALTVPPAATLTVGAGTGLPGVGAWSTAYMVQGGMCWRHKVSTCLCALLMGCVPRLVECDVKNIECQSDVFESVAEQLGVSGAERPTVRVLSEQEFEADLLADPGLAGDEDMDRALQLLGFLPKGRTLLSYHVELIGFTGEGYYDPKSRTITLVDRPDRSFEELLKRYVFAIMHREYGLVAHERGIPLDDESLAVRAVMEGYTFLQTDLWFDAQYGYSRDEYDLSRLTIALGDIRQDILTNPLSTGLESIWYFPYAEGWSWMGARCLSDEEACVSMMRTPPVSTQIIDDPATAQLEAREPEQPAAGHSAPPRGFEEVQARQLGWWWLEVFLLRSVLSTPELGYSGVDVRYRWAGDRLSIYRKDSELAVAWRVRFATGELQIRQDLIDRVNDSDGPWFAEFLGPDVVIVATESEAALEQWRTCKPEYCYRAPGL